MNQNMIVFFKGRNGLLNFWIIGHGAIHSTAGRILTLHAANRSSISGILNGLLKPSIVIPGHWGRSKSGAPQHRANITNSFLMNKCLFS